MNKMTNMNVHINIFSNKLIIFLILSNISREKRQTLAQKYTKFHPILFRFYSLFAVMCIRQSRWMEIAADLYDFVFVPCCNLLFIRISQTDNKRPYFFCTTRTGTRIHIHFKLWYFVTEITKICRSLMKLKWNFLLPSIWNVIRNTRYLPGS